MKTKLKEFASLKTGPFGTQLHSKEYSDSGVPILNVKNIGFGEVVCDNLDHIPESVAERLSEHRLQEGDIVFGRKGSVDRHAYIDSRYAGWIQGSDCIRVRCDTNINTRYLSHFLKLDYVKKQLVNGAVGSTMASMNTDILGNLNVIVPNSSIQEQIQQVLTTIEEKINLNISIGAEIEETIRQIYDYWFIQFDFPDENGKPYKSSGGEINSEIKIPKGWINSTLGAMVSFFNGINYEKKALGDKTYRIVNVRNITASSFLLDYTNLDCIELKKAQADKYLLSENDILIARSGMPGAVRVIYSRPQDTIFCGFIIRAVPNAPMYRMYLAMSLKRYEGTNATKTGGSILQNVCQDTLSRVPIIVPPEKIVAEFNNRIKPLFDKIDLLTKENEELTTLRDFLLPMLMNGQVKIK